MSVQEKLHPVKLGTSADLLVGQRVYAIGDVAPSLLGMQLGNADIPENWLGTCKTSHCF